MTPQKALDFLHHWTMEIMPAKHIDTLNAAYVALAKLIADAQTAATAKQSDKIDG